MALNFRVIPHKLEFKFVARTSRGAMNHHKIWIISLWDSNQPDVVGYGECAPFEGLSIDDIPDIESRLNHELGKIEGQDCPESLGRVEKYISMINPALPAVVFGIETALLDLYHGGTHKIIASEFYDSHEPIDINGLVWMGDKDEMMDRLDLKIMEGYECIKLKIGALPIEDELKILENARKMIGSDLTLRVDANGAYSAEEVDEILERLSKFKLHSIEQPVKPGQIELMHRLSSSSPIPIALDEELIGVIEIEEKRSLLENIRPQFIVLKPTLLGGLKATQEWINIAEEMAIGWWITSAMESNIGLNAICQFTSQFNSKLPQGLGTSDLYKNNISSPLTTKNGCIFWDKKKVWNLELLE